MKPVVFAAILHEALASWNFSSARLMLLGYLFGSVDPPASDGVQDLRNH